MKHAAAASLSLAAVLAALPATAVAAAVDANQPLAPRSSTSKCTAVKPQPAASCNIKGTVASNNRLIMAQQILDLATCARYCADMRNPINEINYGTDDMPCLSISHDSASGVCTFYRQTPNLIGITKQPNSTTSFYGLSACFNCTSHDCAVSPSTNLFNNPNFALSKKFIGPWYSSAFDLVPNPIGKGNAVRFSFSENTIPNIHQNRDICAQNTYRASIAYKMDQISRTPSSANKTSVVIALQSLIGDCFLSRGFTLSDKSFGTWQELDCTFVASTPAVFTLQFFPITTVPANTKWNLTLANPKLTVVSGALKTKGAKLVTNGGFESGAIAPWKGSSESEYSIYPPTYFVNDDPCKPGEPKFSVVKPGLASTGGTPKSKFRLRFCGMAQGYYYPYASEDDFTLSQKIPTTTLSKPYVLTVEYRVFNGAILNFSLVGSKSSFQTGMEPNSDTHSGISNNTQVFQRIFSGIGQPGTLKIFFQGFTFGYGDGSDDFEKLLAFVDNVSVRALDE